MVKLIIPYKYGYFYGICNTYNIFPVSKVSLILWLPAAVLQAMYVTRKIYAVKGHFYVYQQVFHLSNALGAPILLNLTWWMRFTESWIVRCSQYPP